MQVKHFQSLALAALFTIICQVSLSVCNLNLFNMPPAEGSLVSWHLPTSAGGSSTLFSQSLCTVTIVTLISAAVLI